MVNQTNNTVNHPSSQNYNSANPRFNSALKKVALSSLVVGAGVFFARGALYLRSLTAPSMLKIDEALEPLPFEKLSQKVLSETDQIRLLLRQSDYQRRPDNEIRQYRDKVISTVECVQEVFKDSIPAPYNFIDSIRNCKITHELPNVGNRIKCADSRENRFVDRVFPFQYPEQYDFLKAIPGGMFKETVHVSGLEVIFGILRDRDSITLGLVVHDRFYPVSSAYYVREKDPRDPFGQRKTQAFIIDRASIQPCEEGVESQKSSDFVNQIDFGERFRASGPVVKKIILTVQKKLSDGTFLGEKEFIDLFLLNKFLNCCVFSVEGVRGSQFNRVTLEQGILDHAKRKHGIRKNLELPHLIFDSRGRAYHPDNVIFRGFEFFKSFSMANQLAIEKQG